MKNKIQILAVAVSLLILSGCAAGKPKQESSFSESKIDQTEIVRQGMSEYNSNSQALNETESSSTKSSTEEESKPSEETKVPTMSEKPVENKSASEKQPEKKQSDNKPSQTSTTISNIYPSVIHTENSHTENSHTENSHTEINHTEVNHTEVNHTEISHTESYQEENKSDKTTSQSSDVSSQDSETSEFIPKEEKPEIKIDDWIAFGKKYAQSVGLGLHPGAVDCWDTPITATDPAYMERDIKSRLNHYSSCEDITEVWLWSESDGKGGYLLYIGYA